MEQVRTVYGDVNKAIEILNGIDYHGTDEVIRFGAPVANAVALLKDCVAAWDREAAEGRQKQEEQAAEEAQEPDIECIETGIDGGTEDGQETNT